MFNHNPADLTTDALNISKDGEELVTAPEWRSGASINHEDSPAAYAISETQGNVIKIKAKFKSDLPLSGPVEIQAIELDENLPHDEHPIPFLARLIRPAVRRLMRGPLGSIAAKPITFNDAGETDFIDFDLPNVRLQERGVGVSNITWGWQFRVGRGGWTTFEKSRHRIYTLLSKPQDPWKLLPENGSPLHLPWTGILDYACLWADGAKTPAEAATLITHSLYKLGRSRVTYDKTVHYIHTATGDFLCATFLFELQAGKSRVNCIDCAMIVSTFANALGCKLSQSKITGFQTNPVLLIGRTTPQAQDFNIQHEVAWEGGSDVDDAVYDACLQLDGDDDPTQNFQDPLLPTDLRFGRDGERFYRFRLVSPENDDSRGRPQPQTSTHRPLSAEVLHTARLVGMPSFDFAASSFDFDSWREGASQGPNLFFWRIAANAGVPQGWQPLRIKRYKTTEGTSFLEAHLRVPGQPGESLVRIDLYEGFSSADALNWIVEFLASLHTFEGLTRGPKDLGDVSFILGDEGDVIFARANLAVAVRNAGSKDRPLEDMAWQLDRAFVGSPHREGFISLPQIEFFKFADRDEFAVGDIPLKMNEENPLAGLPLVYKFISGGGHVSARGETLFYHPAPQEPQPLTVFAINLNGRALRQDLPLP
jgi:hypothetical protein